MNWRKHMVLTKDHYIQLKDGAFDGTSKDDLDNLFKTLAADAHRDNIVLHFHGGLVDAVRATQTAENQPDAGACFKPISSAASASAISASENASNLAR